jgi:hypothetical protein
LHDRTGPRGKSAASIPEYARRKMKQFLLFALMFSCAAAVQAQEPAGQDPAEPAAERELSVPAEEAPVPVVDLKTRSATAAAVDAATLRAPADMDLVDQSIDAPRNFWWLVGAIVLAGIILAVVL